MKKTYKEKVNIFGLMMIIVLGSLFFGLKRIERYSAVDEHLWTIERIPKLVKALKDRDWSDTKINDKPGFTVAAVASLGKWDVRALPYEKIWSGPKSQEEILNVIADYKSFRLPVYLFTFLFMPVFFFVIRKNFNLKIASYSIILIYLSPVILGISLFVNPDSFFWIFVPLSLMFYMQAVAKNSGKDAILAGIFLGLALLTKYVAAISYLFFLFMTVIEFGRPNTSDSRADMRKLFDIYLKTILASSFVIAILFPAVWEKPSVFWETTFMSRPMKLIWPYFFSTTGFLAIDVFFLRSKFSLWAGKIFQKYKPIIFKMANIAFLSLLIFVILNVYLRMPFFDFEKILSLPKGLPFLTFSPVSILGSMTAGIYVMAFGILPMALLFFILMLIFNIRNGKSGSGRYFRETSLLLSFALFYYLSTAINQVEATLRYQIALFPFFIIVSAVGLCETISFMKEKFGGRIRIRTIHWVAGIFLLTISAYSLSSISPYYFSYASSLLPKRYILNVKSMGDGSFEAAEYLNSLPNAQNLSIWTDKVAVCETFLGKCSFSIKNKNINNKKFDYYILSRGNEQKSLSLINARKIKSEEFMNFGRYYSLEYDPEYAIIIDRRPGNYVRVVESKQ